MMSIQTKSLTIPPYSGNSPSKSNSTTTDSNSHNSTTSPSSNHSDLSERCRRLAASLGDSAIQQHQFEHSPDLLSINLPPSTTNTNNSSPPSRRLSQISLVPSNNNLSNNNISSNSGTSMIRNHSPNSINGGGNSSDNGSGLEGIDEDPNESKYANDLESSSLFTSSFKQQHLEPNNVLFKGYSLATTTTTTSGTTEMLDSPIILDESEEEVEVEVEEDAIKSLGLPLSKENQQAQMIREVLKSGNSSIRVKCWLIDGELIYGNDRATLSPINTLYSGYVHPLHKLLTPGYQKGHHRRRSSSSFSQITPTSPLQLIISLQNDPSTAFQFLLHEIKVLHDDSLLTTFCPRSNLTFPGLVTVSLSGDEEGIVPREEIELLSPRYVFEEGRM